MYRLRAIAAPLLQILLVHFWRLLRRWRERTWPVRLTPEIHLARRRRPIIPAFTAPSNSFLILRVLRYSVIAITSCNTLIRVATRRQVPPPPNLSRPVRAMCAMKKQMISLQRSLIVSSFVKRFVYFAHARADDCLTRNLCGSSRDAVDVSWNCGCELQPHLSLFLSLPRRTRTNERSDIRRNWDGTRVTTLEEVNRPKTNYSARGIIKAKDLNGRRCSREHGLFLLGRRALSWKAAAGCFALLSSNALLSNVRSSSLAVVAKRWSFRTVTSLHGWKACRATSFGQPHFHSGFWNFSCASEISAIANIHINYLNSLIACRTIDRSRQQDRKVSGIPAGGCLKRFASEYLKTSRYSVTQLLEINFEPSVGFWCRIRVAQPAFCIRARAFQLTWTSGDQSTSH